jgi:cytochrome c oxidase subunit 1
VSGILIVVINLLASLRKGEKASADPWGGKTLEWTIPSPPPLENFQYDPIVTKHPYDYSEYEKNAVRMK